MKKTYINPELEVIKIATQQMLAASTELLDTGSYDGGEIFAPENDFIDEELFEADDFDEI